jgi:hypothetical protein
LTGRAIGQRMLTTNNADYALLDVRLIDIDALAGDVATEGSAEGQHG